MARKAQWFDDTKSALDELLATVEATTQPTAVGERIVAGNHHAVLLSRAAQNLHNNVGAVTRWLTQQGGRADLTLFNLLLDAASVTGFPVDRWNEMQAADPGGDHLRYREGDLLSANDLWKLNAASKALKLSRYAGGPATDDAEPTPPKTNTKPKRKGGRKPLSETEMSNRLRLVQKWKRAKESGVTMKSFCEGRSDKIKTLEKAVNWWAKHRFRQGDYTQQ